MPDQASSTGSSCQSTAVSGSPMKSPKRVPIAMPRRRYMRSCERKLMPAWNAVPSSKWYVPSARNCVSSSSERFTWSWKNENV